MSITKQYTIADYIARWGNSSSIALFDPACKIFSVPNLEGVIGYRIEASNAIVFGDPLCPAESKHHLITAFNDNFRNKVKNIIYVTTSEQFTNWSLQHHYKAAIGICHEIILNPTVDPRIGTGEKAALLRRKYNQAARCNVVVHEYTGNDPEIEATIERIGKTWIENRQGPQIYLQHVHVFADKEHKRYFYAKQDDVIIGVLILNRIDAHNGWILSFLMTLEQAPKGTSELILVCALHTLGKEGSTHFSIGIVPSFDLERIEGLGVITTWFARRIFSLSKCIFGLNDRHRYWKKFRPQTKPMYLVLDQPKVGIGTVLGIMRALNANV